MPVAGGGGDAGDDGAARPRHGRQPADRRADARLRHPRLGQAKARSATSTTSPAKEGWDKVVPTALQQFSKYDGNWIAAPVNVHSTNWVWINKAALDKAGGKEPTTWDELIAAARQDEGRTASPRSPMAARPGRTRPSSTPSCSRWRHRLLQEGLHRPRSGGARRRQDEGGLRPHDQAALLCRRQLLRPRLEPGLGHGDRGQGRHADHGRLGQGRVPQGRQGAGHGLRLHPLPRHAGLGHLQLRPVRDVQGRRRQEGRPAADGLAPSRTRRSSRPSTWSRARSRRAPTCRTPPSTIAARRASRTWPKPTPTARCSARWPMATPHPAAVKNAIYDVVTAPVQRRARLRQAAASELVEAVAAAQVSEPAARERSEAPRLDLRRPPRRTVPREADSWPDITQDDRIGRATTDRRSTAAGLAAEARAGAELRA